MIAAALLVLLAQAPERHVLIAGGAPARAGAEQALAKWERARKAISGLVDGGEAPATIVESATVPGLKPGLFVVIVGVCTAADAHDLLPLLKIADPGTYERALTGDGLPLSCPRRLGETDRTDRVIDSGKTLEIVRLRFGPKESPDVRYRIVAVVRDETGRIFDAAEVGSTTAAPPGTAYAGDEHCDQDFHRVLEGWNLYHCHITDKDRCNGELRLTRVSLAKGKISRTEMAAGSYGIPCD